jgi:hypothetical protein
MKLKSLLTLVLLSSLPFVARAEEEQSAPEPGFTVNGYTMQSFEYFNYDADGTQNIEFGWEEGRSEASRECARTSQVELRSALENLTKDGVDQLGLIEYGFSSIYLITADYDLVPNAIRDGRVWAWGQDEDTQRNGLIKFQGYQKNGECRHPTEADLLAFAQRQIQKIKAIEEAQEDNDGAN